MILRYSLNGLRVLQPRTAGLGARKHEVEVCDALSYQMALIK